MLRPGGRGCVMVYNRDSVWFHLYTAYERMIVDDAFPGLDVDDAFTRNTDGPDCPISRGYRGPDFLALCEEAGFEAGSWAATCRGARSSRWTRAGPRRLRIETARL